MRANHRLVNADDLFDGRETARRFGQALDYKDGLLAPNVKAAEIVARQL